jgi:hypothetical protein
LQLKLLIIALIIVGMANVYLEIGGDENFIIVTPSQKECLKSWVDVEGEYDIYGPEVFDGHSIVSVGTKLESNYQTSTTLAGRRQLTWPVFRFNFKACFFR